MSSVSIGTTGLFDEYIAATEGVGVYGETPEEYLCHRETLDELFAVLNACTETQCRFFLYALDGLSYEQIARLSGCTKFAVRDSIEAIRKKFRDFFKSSPHETEFSG